MPSYSKINLICVLGPTASGKTGFAARLALMTGAEIISADSRQVYRGMNIGTGKDLEAYIINNTQVPFHLIDIADAGTEYNVYQFQKDFITAFKDITARGKLPLLCGGTAMYIDAVMKGYRLAHVPENPALRDELRDTSMQELEKRLLSYRRLHNTTDVTEKARLIRAIEIEEYYHSHPASESILPELKYLIFGISADRETRRSQITERLRLRLENGMIDEVRLLLDSGIPSERLITYGLEYKFITWYLKGKISYEDMFRDLNTAIHQYSKRQMTWFRKMEKEGIKIHWIDCRLNMDEKLNHAGNILSKYL